MNHNNSLRLLTLNHFFTSNRLLCRNSGSNSSKRRALRVTTSVSGGTGSKIFLQNKHSLRRVLPFYKNYYMFIEFAKTFNR